ncbi:MAG: hypothetical protein V5A38_08600 [Halolamina sp.]|uniref:DUF7344 domain-containing protein n=1 Tax=Halolamina sp. TaxID=1940283 RepID=UPI002FC36AEA
MNASDRGTNPNTQSQEHSDGERDAEQSDANDEVSLTKNEIFTILKNPRRRETLEYLERNDGEAELSDLAESLAARENDIEIEALSSTQRKRVYISLYQVHLPKMDDVGVIEFGKHRGTIELTDAGEILLPYLYFDPHSDEQSSEETDSTPLRTVRDRLSGFIGSDEN